MKLESISRKRGRKVKLLCDHSARVGMSLDQSERTVSVTALPLEGDLIYKITLNMEEILRLIKYI